MNCIKLGTNWVDFISKLGYECAGSDAPCWTYRCLPSDIYFPRVSHIFPSCSIYISRKPDIYRQQTTDFSVDEKNKGIYIFVPLW